MILTKDKALIAAMLEGPRVYAPLQSSAYGRVEQRMVAQQFIEDGNRQELSSLLQHRHDLLIEDACQRIRSAGTARQVRWRS